MTRARRWLMQRDGKPRDPELLARQQKAFGELRELVDGPGTVTVTETGGGWKKGDVQCATHLTGYSAGCMTCRNLEGNAR